MRSNHTFWFVTAAVSILFACAVALPYVVQRMDPKANYQGIVMMPTDAETHYAARVREITDGFWETGNTFYSEPKHQPFLQPPVPEMAMAATAWILHVDPVYGLLLFSILGAIALVCTMVGFLSRVTGTKWIALLAVVVLLFAGKFLGSPWEILSIVKLPTPESPVFDYLRFSRPVNPLWTVPWFFGFLWLLTAYLERGGRMRWAAMLAILLVLLWSYVYAWTFTLVILVLLTTFLYFSGEKQKARQIAGLLIAFGILSLPYLWHLYETAHHPFFLESSQRLGMVRTHMPIVGIWALIFPVVALVSRSLWPRHWLLILACSLAGIIALNQHVITGSFIVPHHYHWYFIQPLASVFTIIALCIAWKHLNRLPKLTQPLFCVLVAFCVVWGFWQQYGRYREMAPLWASFQQYAPVMEYFKEHGKAGEVVYSTQWDLMDLLPVYTSVDVYTSTNANNYLVPHNRARDVYFFELWLKGVTTQQAAKDFSTTRRKELSSRIYAIYYREELGDYAKIPDAVVAKYLAEYRAYVRKPLSEKIQLYPLTYVVLKNTDDLTPELRSVISQGSTIWSDNGWNIVRMK